MLKWKILFGLYLITVARCLDWLCNQQMQDFFVDKIMWYIFLFQVECSSMADMAQEIVKSNGFSDGDARLLLLL